MKDEKVVEIRRRVDKLESEMPSRKQFDRGGGSGDDGGVEARLAKLEAAFEFIRAEITDVKVELRALRADQRGDFRLLFASLIAAALGLAGVLAKGFHWL